MLPRAQADEMRNLAARTDAFLEEHFRLDRGWLAWAARLLQDCAAVTEAEAGAGVQVQPVCALQCNAPCAVFPCHARRVHTMHGTVLRPAACVKHEA